MMPITELIRTERKTIALIVRRDGQLVVRAPFNATDEAIRALIEKKSAWIQSKQKLVRETYPVFKPKEYVNGEGFWYLGKIYRLEIVETAIEQPLVLSDNFYLSQSALPQAGNIFERWYRAQAKTMLSERVAWYADKHGYAIPAVKITDAHTRWGSCSARGSVSFAWRLVMAPMPVIDYLVAHELAHLLVKNHSTEFWGKVSLMMPNYEQQIEWLEINGHLLNLG